MNASLGLSALLIGLCTCASACDAPPASEGEGEPGPREGEGESEGEGEGEGEADPVDGGFVDGADGGVIPAECSSTDQLALYERRIEPLVSGDVPSSCQQCHFEGTSLASFVQDSPCETMACLVESGEVDLANPNGSAILGRILNAQPDSELITEEVIQAEHDGFLEWIEWSAICQNAVCGEIENPCVDGATGPPPPDVLTPLGGCDEAALVQTFNAKVFQFRGRCNSCHAVYGPDRDANEDNGTAPIWIDGLSNTPDADDARNTMYNIIGRGLINVDDPPQSLLVLKPQNLPAEPHLGGAKFANTQDAEYLSFLSWIRDDYAQCVNDIAAEGEGEGEGEGEDQLPVVSLDHPGAKDGPRPAGVAIPWIGTASDPQDGNLCCSQLVWSSDIAGPFGEGESFDAPLPIGTHVVTLTATDSDGNSGTDTVTVVVE